MDKWHDVYHREFNKAIPMTLFWLQDIQAAFPKIDEEEIIIGIRSLGRDKANGKREYPPSVSELIERIRRLRKQAEVRERAEVNEKWQKEHSVQPPLFDGKAPTFQDWQDSGPFVQRGYIKCHYPTLYEKYSAIEPPKTPRSVFKTIYADSIPQEVQDRLNAQAMCFHDWEPWANPTAGMKGKKCTICGKVVASNSKPVERQPYVDYQTKGKRKR